jgi:hypothetical protein
MRCTQLGLSLLYNSGGFTPLPPMYPWHYRAPGLSCLDDLRMVNIGDKDVRIKAVNREDKRSRR